MYKTNDVSLTGVFPSEVRLVGMEKIIVIYEVFIDMFFGVI